MSRQIEHHFSFGDIPDFQGGIFGAADEETRICRPRHLVDWIDMASERRNVLATLPVPQLYRLVE